jgi:hypothetical protein
MTTFPEVKSLVDAARGLGAVIEYSCPDDNGDATLVNVVSGIPGCGPYAMPLIAAAEKLRGFLAARAAKDGIGSLSAAMQKAGATYIAAPPARLYPTKPDVGQIFDAITGASYYGAGFRDVLRNDPVAYDAALILASAVGHLNETSKSG